MQLPAKVPWRYTVPPLEKGIIVGCDQRQEWILPWWWKHYTKHNSLPVTFVDWGLSEEANQWCRERGELVFLRTDCFKCKEREALDSTLVAVWEKGYGTGFWDSRKSWFHKPFALLLTPYQKTAWLDLDCQVKDNLNALFETAHEEIALCPLPDYDQDYELEHYHKQFDLESQLTLQNEVVFNSGVILYRHASPLIQNWAQQVILRSEHFLGDQNLLSRIIFENNYPVSHLKQIYNWYVSFGMNPHAKIIHFIGDFAKELIWAECL